MASGTDRCSMSRGVREKGGRKGGGEEERRLAAGGKEGVINCHQGAPGPVHPKRSKF